VHVLAVAVATVTSFVISSIWYVGFARVLGRLNPAYADTAGRPAWLVPLELLRAAVLGTVIAIACHRAGIDSVGSAVAAALLAWVGFPVVLLAGSVLHERVPWRLAAIHAGDWLLKLVAVTLIVGLWS
jgi:hypothetical protein